MIWERGKTNVKRMPGGEKGKTENHSILCTWELLTGCRKTIGTLTRMSEQEKKILGIYK
jgi:hypothetical protein